MARMKPLKREDIPELHDLLQATEDRMGFIPESGLTMARRPNLVRAIGALARVIYTPTESVPVSLRNMIAHIASKAAGCVYCAAHTASNALRPGSDLDAAKLDNIWNYETDPMFSERERIVLRFAQSAASVPNTVTDKDFVDMRKYFSEEDIVDILGLISYFGFLNRWNDTMATDLEDLPKSVAENHLRKSGWEIGKHTGSTE